MKKLHLLTALLIFSLLAGCSGSTGTETPASNGSDTDSEEPIYIAMMTALTGTSQEYGASCKAAAELAVEEVNSKGGLLGRQVVLECFDDKNDPTEAINMANQIVDADKYACVIGNYGSGPALVAAPIINEAGIPYSTGTAGHVELTDVGEYIFRCGPTQKTEGKYGANYARMLGYTKCGTIFVNDDWGNNTNKKFIEAFEELGGTVNFSESFIPDQTSDFTPLLAKLQSADVEVVYLVTYYGDSAAILNQAAGLNMDTQFMLSTASVRTETLDIGGDNVNGCVAASPFPFGYEGERFQEVSKTYAAARGQDFNVHAYNNYNNAWVLFQAIEKAGSTDHEAIRNALATETFDLTLLDDTTVKFDEEREAGIPYFAVKVEDGAFQLLQTIALNYEDNLK